jgi:hypothetical protein
MSSIEERSVRRSQLISPWGIGSILSLPNNESVMIAGLDFWMFDDEESLRINDKRLAKRLGVEKLLMPPDFRTPMEDPTDRKSVV